MVHYDLFAGIGGFSLAIDEVFYDTPIKHVFCEWDGFCTSVLKQYWPDSDYYGDIADLVADTESGKNNGRRSRKLAQTKASGQSSDTAARPSDQLTILTGGFPCQPFSIAGRRRGTTDNRYKWPEMFAIIRNVKPDWIIAENVRGFVTWNDGMVLEQVCTDLESEGYEVQPLIIPAVAVNAPHRRERVWIIANRSQRDDRRCDRETQARQKSKLGISASSSPFANSRRQRRQSGGESIRSERQESERKNGSECGQQHPSDPKCMGQPSGNFSNARQCEESNKTGWTTDWQEVAFATCYDGVDDGLSRIVDGVPYSRAKWRKESLKSYGNAIVPQVAMQILYALKTTLTK